MRVGRVALALVCLLGAGGGVGCGSASGGVGRIPPLRGNDVEPIGASVDADGLARRAAAELETGQAARAERFARWALSLAPEHAGALVVAARVAASEGDHEGARRAYALAAASQPESSKAIEGERGAQLIAYAKAELAVGRVEAAAALVEELEAALPGVESAERRALAALHGALADVWLARGLAGPGKRDAEKASTLGAAAGESEARLAFVEVLAAQPTPGLGAFEGKLVEAIGRDAEGYVRVAQWSNALGRGAWAEWAAKKALAIDDDRAEAWLALARAQEQIAASSTARDTILEAGAHLPPADAAAALLAMAERVDPRAGAGSGTDARATKPEAAIELYAIAAAEVAPGSEGGLGGATLAAFLLLNGSDPEREARALALLESAARAAPRAWRRIIAPAQARGDLYAVARTLAAARAAGLVDWVAHTFEAAQWRQIGGGSASAELKSEAAAEGERAFSAGLQSKPGFFGWLELARLAVGEPARATALRGAAGAVGPAGRGALAYLDAREAKVERAQQREALEAGLAGVPPFESLYVRAHFELEGGDPERVPALADEALAAAGPDEVAAAESFALRTALNGGAQRVEARARSWLARASDAAVVEAPLRAQTLVRLLASTRASVELNAGVHAAVLADEGARWSVDRDNVRRAYIGLLQKLGRWDELEAAWVTALEATVAPRRADEITVKLTPSDDAATFLRLTARVHPDEIQRVEVLAELPRLLFARGEPVRARRVAERILGLADGQGLGTSRLAALGQELFEANQLELASRVLERIVASGERAPKVYGAWLRARVRAGDMAGADQVAARWLETRPKNDVRAADEPAKALTEEGELARAIALLEASVAKSERLEPSTFGTLLDLYARTGRDEALGPLTRRFIAGDARAVTRYQAIAAPQLAEVGALDAAQALVDEALALRPRDMNMLQLALTIALARGGDVDAVADKVLREAGGFDAWDKLVGQIRASLRPDLATRLIGGGLERYTGSHRLLLLRGRVALSAGQAEAAVDDFNEAMSRAPTPRDVLEQLEPQLQRMAQFERLAGLEARALALAPGRADATLMLGRALVAAGMVDEASQVFQRVVAETDRAHALVAEAWFQSGHLALAVDAWAKVEPTLAEDAAVMLDHVAAALARRGEAARLETFVRLYLQAMRGAKSPPLLPIAEAYRVVGRPDEALRWIERADREAPSPESALALMRRRLERGDREGALAAAEKVVVRRLAAAPPVRLGAGTMAPALDPVALELTALGEPGLARELARRVAASQGASMATQLVTARALCAEGDVAGALRELEAPFEPWRGQRELIGILRGVLGELVARGHVEAAKGIALRAVEAGPEREVLLAATRIAARAGDGPTALALGHRLAATAPMLNGWLVADLWASERMRESARAALATALGQGLGDAALKATVLAATRSEGGDLAALERAVAMAPRLRDDRVERAQAEAYAASALYAPDAPAFAARAVLPALRRGTVDPNLANTAAVMASFAGDEAQREVWKALRRVNPDEVKLRMQLGSALAADHRLAAALAMFDPLYETEGGDGELALRVFELALTLGDEARARRWADAALGRIPGAQPPTLTQMFALAAAELGAHTLAAELVTAAPADATKGAREPSDTWRRALVSAHAALDAGDVGGWRAAIERRLVLAPDEAVARVESAELLLATRAARESAWADEARRILEPLLKDDETPRAALELAFATSRDEAGARAAWERLRVRFPGAPERVAAMLGACVRIGSAHLTAALLAALSPEATLDALDALVAARVSAGDGPLAAELAALFVRAAARAPTDARAVRVEAELARLSGDVRGAAAALEGAAARAPWSSELAAALAQSLAVTKRDVARAERVVEELAARPRELDLFDADLRLIAAPTSPRTWEAIAAVALAKGDRARARTALERALVVATDSDAPRLALAIGSPEALRTCVQSARAPWSPLCYARLHP